MKFFLWVFFVNIIFMYDIKMVYVILVGFCILFFVKVIENFFGMKIFLI